MVDRSTPCRTHRHRSHPPAAGHRGCRRRTGHRRCPGSSSCADTHSRLRSDIGLGCQSRRNPSRPSSGGLPGCRNRRRSSRRRGDGEATTDPSPGPSHRRWQAVPVATVLAPPRPLPDPQPPGATHRPVPSRLRTRRHGYHPTACGEHRRAVLLVISPVTAPPIYDLRDTATVSLWVNTFPAGLGNGKEAVEIDWSPWRPWMRAIVSSSTNST